jgi:hypothetical protein
MPFGVPSALSTIQSHAGDWHIECVDCPKQFWAMTDRSLRLDGEGYPHIAYGENHLYYAWHDEIQWHYETVDQSSGVGEYASLALDRLSRPHISYSSSDDYGRSDLKYAWHDGTGWQIETVDGYGDVGRFTSLALDGLGLPHISYFDGTNAALKYAYLLPPLLLDKQATPRDGVRNGDTLTYTLTLSSPDISVHLWDPLPAAVQYVSDSITNTVAPLAVYSPTAHAVVWEGTLPTDTAQLIRFEVTITGGEPLSLSLPIVNTAWLTDTEYGRSVSATVIVNGWRVYLPLVMRGYSPLTPLRNPGFEGITCRSGSVPPECLDNWTRDTHDGNVYPDIYTPQGWTTWWRTGGSYGRPGVAVIPNVPPFNLGPPRIRSGYYAVQTSIAYYVVDAGLYQVVSGLAPGATAQFSAYGQGWSCDNDANPGYTCGDPWSMVFQVGIEPNGVADPFAPTVIWSPEQNSPDAFRLIGPATAQVGPGGSVTVFIRAKTKWGYKYQEAYWDDASLTVLTP